MNAPSSNSKEYAGLDITQRWLQEEQYNLETEALDMGIAREQDNEASREPSERYAERKLLAAIIAPVMEAIELAQGVAADGKAAKGVTKWGPPLLSLTSDRLALITLRTMLNMLHQPLSSISGNIGYAVKMEREIEQLKDTHPVVYKLVRERNTKWTKQQHRRAKRLAQVVDAQWDKSRIHHLGMKLIEIAVEYTVVFTIYKRRQGKNYINVLGLNDDVDEEMRKLRESKELIRPQHMPMVVRPLPWDDNKHGGYIYHREPLIKPSPFIRQDEELQHHEAPRLEEAVNYLQDVPFVIDEDIVEVMRTLWMTETEYPTVLPYKTDLPLPRKPEDYDDNQESRATYIKQRNRIRSHNAERQSKRISILSTLYVAERMKPYPSIYFPRQLDWRGREYPLPASLHPQGEDLSRGLLRFARDEVITSQGRKWLRVHTANCWGLDKETFGTRAKWAMENITMMLSIANDPLEDRRWMQADSPWQFLAACLEWKRIKETGRTSLIIWQDGTCNGLQHLSAMGRDSRAGSSVNLVPGMTPQDIYSEVAAECQAILRDLVDGRDTGIDRNDRTLEYAHHWMTHLTRNTVKRAVMTTPYSVTEHGLKDQFISDKHTDSYAEAVFLRDLVVLGVRKAIVRAKEVMDWLQRCVAVAAEAGQPLRWVTPIGHLVRHEYVEGHVQHIHTASQKLTLWSAADDADIDIRRQVLGIVPNLVHSFDASHMMMTALRMKNDGFNDFVSVHDSFGTNANAVDSMRHHLLEAFIEIYQTDWLSHFHKGWQLELGIELPEPPDKGDLNIEDIRYSTYAFH